MNERCEEIIERRKSRRRYKIKQRWYLMETPGTKWVSRTNNRKLFLLHRPKTDVISGVILHDQVARKTTSHKMMVLLQLSIDNMEDRKQKIIFNMLL